MTRPDCLPDCLMSSTVAIGGATTIRRLAALEEYRQCEKLQERIWGAVDVAGNRLVAMLTAQENGGLVLGAFAESGELAGFVYSFVGLGPQRRLQQCSVMLAVEEKYRGQGLGYQLKRAQRLESLAQGIELVTWTFDPLQQVNATLNIRRLGGIARTYRANLYGGCDGLNFGMDTDRLIIEWWLRRHPRPRHWSEPGMAVPVNQVMADEITGLPRIMATDLDVDSDDLFLAIPPSLHELKQRDLSLAQEWRALTRSLFLNYLGRGYVVVDFITAGAWPGYVLRRPAW
jgi:predicted GNAT superfamily acetyltransferase